MKPGACAQCPAWRSGGSLEEKAGRALRCRADGTCHEDRRDEVEEPWAPPGGSYRNVTFTGSSDVQRGGR